jgi:hypothetical protein
MGGDSDTDGAGGAAMEQWSANSHAPCRGVVRVWHCLLQLPNLRVRLARKQVSGRTSPDLTSLLMWVWEDRGVGPG